MKIINVLDSKIVQIGLHMYEAHVFVQYKTIFGRIKHKWILLENSCWAGNLDWFSSLEHAKNEIKLYIAQINNPKSGVVVFQGIPK